MALQQMTLYTHIVANVSHLTDLYCTYLTRGHSSHWSSAAHSDGATLRHNCHVTLNCKNIYTIQEYVHSKNETWDNILLLL